MSPKVQNNNVFRISLSTPFPNLQKYVFSTNTGLQVLQLIFCSNATTIYRYVLVIMCSKFVISFKYFGEAFVAIVS